jgi:hypothetical protein
MAERSTTYEELRAQAGPQRPEMAGYSGLGVTDREAAEPSDPVSGNRAFGVSSRPLGGRRGPGVPAWDRDLSVSAVFDCFESFGLRPYPTDHPDEEFQTTLWTREYSIALLESCARAPARAPGDVVADPALGVNNLHISFISDAPDSNRQDMTAYNTPPGAMFDLAKVGVGTLRHFQEADLAWDKIFHAREPIALPGEMRGMLSADEWAVLGRFAYTVITALYSGQQLVPLLFSYGGGENAFDGVVTAFEKPAFQSAAYAPSAAGWDKWYWDLGVGTGEAALLRNYQRYALNLLRASGDDDAYTQQVVYRKCFGLLSFASAIADYFELLDQAIRSCSSGSACLLDVVPAIECGNEMNTFYKLEANHIDDAAREMARYHALLSAPIMAKGLGLEARLGEAYFWIQEPAQWDRTVRWLRLTITLGLVEELDRWWELSLDPESDPEWSAIAASREVQWEWWEGVAQVRDLVHQVGFHWFTWSNETYRDENALHSEVDDLIYQVAEHPDVVALLGRSLDWTCSLGFQGSRPSLPGADLAKECFEGNTLAYQGGMVARRMLAALGHSRTPRFVTWYTMMPGLSECDIPWRLFASTGLRNTLFEPPKASSGLTEPVGPVSQYSGTFLHEAHAWRRPSWFSMRRVAWLLARTKRVERLFGHSFASAMLLRLEAEDGFYLPASAVISMSGDWEPERFRYAYLAWIGGEPGGTARFAGLTVRLHTRGGGGWVVMPLVPRVTCVGSDDVDENDFPDIESADWDSTPQTSTVRDVSAVGGQTIQIDVKQSHPETNPSPICVLCNHTLSRVGVESLAGAASRGDFSR